MIFLCLWIFSRMLAGEVAKSCGFESKCVLLFHFSYSVSSGLRVRLLSRWAARQHGFVSEQGG